MSAASANRPSGFWIIEGFLSNELREEFLRRYIEKIRQLVELHRRDELPTERSLRKMLSDLAKLCEECWVRYGYFVLGRDYWNAYRTKFRLVAYIAHALAIMDFLEALEEVRHREQAQNE